MKYLDAYRNPIIAQQIFRKIHRITTKPWVIMDVCGGQTQTIIKYGIDTFLPTQIELLHGPGCPACVAPLEIIDRALSIAARPEVIFCSFGDMLHVPGSTANLLAVKAKGGDVRIVNSPLESVKIAKENPDKEIVFFAVGFETTAPADAMAVDQAKASGLKNFSLLVSHVLVPAAMEAILSSKNNRVQGFLAPGPVCAVMGYNEYIPIAAKYKVPVIVTGVDPLDLLEGIAMCIRQLEIGKYEVENQYVRSVTQQGDIQSQEIMKKVFDIVPRHWRGIGDIPQSGFALRGEYKDFDAGLKFNLTGIKPMENPDCISGLILQGVKKPNECPGFGTQCTPEHPLGAPMGSSEGACWAYFRYKRDGQ